MKNDGPKEKIDDIFPLCCVIHVSLDEFKLNVNNKALFWIFPIFVTISVLWTSWHTYSERTSSHLPGS